MEEEAEFNWEEYMEETGADAAPHTTFKHVSVWSSPHTLISSPRWSLKYSLMDKYHMQRNPLTTYWEGERQDLTSQRQRRSIQRSHWLCSLMTHDVKRPLPSFENTIEGNYWSTKENYTMGTNKRHIVSFFSLLFKKVRSVFTKQWQKKKSKVMVFHFLRPIF